MYLHVNWYLVLKHQKDCINVCILNISNVDMSVAFY